MSHAGVELICKEVVFVESEDLLGNLIASYLEDYLAENHAAGGNGDCVLSYWFSSVIDHLTFQTLNIEERAREFVDLGYEHEPRAGVVHAPIGGPRSTASLDTRPCSSVKRSRTRESEKAVSRIGSCLRGQTSYYVAVRSRRLRAPSSIWKNKGFHLRSDCRGKGLGFEAGLCPPGKKEVNGLQYVCFCRTPAGYWGLFYADRRIIEIRPGID